MSMVIAVDFDGTLVTHEYPKIGEEVPLAFNYLRALQTNGDRLILWTVRSGEFLEQAIEFCRNRGIEFWAVNNNPEQANWTDSPKCYAQVYVDDASIGTPLMSQETVMPFVNWGIVGPLLLKVVGVEE